MRTDHHALREKALNGREVEGRLGFEMGGYLAIAIGLSFILIGRKLPRSYYLFWAAVFFVTGAISLYAFLAFHVSQLIWLTAALLGAYYLRSSADAAGN